jgi:hypothetical protein
VRAVDLFDEEPTTADLADIEREWPLIEAELALLDAEIAALVAGGWATELDRRRVRRAQRRVLAVRTAIENTGTASASDDAATQTGAAA